MQRLDRPDRRRWHPAAPDLGVASRWARQLLALRRAELSNGDERAAASTEPGLRLRHGQRSWYVRRAHAALSGTFSALREGPGSRSGPRESSRVGSFRDEAGGA